ncbi:major facilitator superfamily permease [Corynebacterium deserti GIMN1.010]|uniref:Major facilitator superfamily permease n=1 Tax=Corynebacterium deserti GIMN1.010 TaxID=931089 RepID=A0A0M5IPP4_9CORY|nr:multidrug effflux MFS transporter [Corynebacterium deserti]ALC06818.1 major facilitator superfamily permease [Corynebacterium deserti GIMN1.010]
MANKQQLGTGLILALALLSASSALSTDMYLPAMPGIAQDLSTTAPMVQLTLSGFMVGMAFGQLIIGPLSDQFGRKNLLVGGAVAALIASVLCASAPSISVLVAARVVQGIGGGACMVIARAIVPDLARGQAAAQAFALLMIIQGVAPVAAPLVGGLLVGPFGWRGTFWALALINLVQLAVSVFVIKESRPKEERVGAGLGGMLANYLFVLRNKQFVAYTFTLALSFGAMFSYISASPFVLQDELGIPVLMYSIVFGVNACGLIIGGVVNRRLLQKHHPHHIMRTVQFSFATFCALLLVEVLFIHWVPLFLVLLFLIVSHIPMIMANSTALGTEVVRQRAGSGSAILGFTQFTMAALVSPLVGLGDNKALTMAIAMVVCALAAILCSYVAGKQGIPKMG